MKSDKLESYKQKYNEGMAFYGKKDYKQAIESFTHAQSSEDSKLKIKATYYSGQSYYTLKHYPKAISCFHHVTEDYKNVQVSADNEIINDFIIPAYHYKGNALYALKKYQGAVNCFTKIPDYHELALVANLYRGFCYERLKFSQLEHAESCYKKVLKLYPASDYRDKDIIKDMVQGALIKNLIHQDKNDELIRVYTEELGKQLDEPDSSGNTLLMYATIHNNKKLIENLLEKNCDPFKADKFGNSAVSIAFDERKEELAEEFFIKFSQLKFDSLEEGGFTRYIAPKMHGNELNEIFHNNQTSIDTCLDAVERYCECLGDTPDYLA